MLKEKGLLNGAKGLSGPRVCTKWPGGQCGWSVRAGVGAEKGSGQVSEGCWVGGGVWVLSWGQGPSCA